MATRYGGQIADELVAKGWTIKADSDPEVYGDPRVIDPQTGEAHTPYEGQKIQAERDAAEGGGG
jgi:hypothetical protein